MIANPIRPFSGAAYRLVRSRILNRDSIDIAAQRLSPLGGPRLHAWLLDAEGGDGGRALVQSCPHMAPLLGETCPACSGRLSHLERNAGDEDEDPQALAEELCRGARFHFGAGLCVAAAAIHAVVTDPFQLNELTADGFQEALAESPFDDPDAWYVTPKDVAEIIGLSEQFEELSGSQIVMRLTVMQATWALGTARSPLTARFQFFAGCAAGGVDFERVSMAGGMR